MNIIKTINMHTTKPLPRLLSAANISSIRPNPHLTSWGFHSKGWPGNPRWLRLGSGGPLPLVKIKIAASCACSYPCSHGKLIGFEPKPYTYIYIYIHMHVNTNIQYAH